MRKQLFHSAPVSLACLVSLVCIVPAHAAEAPIQAGLWEVSTTSNLINLASQVPPEQLDNINMLMKEYGFELPEIKNGAAKSNVCITPEMAAHKILPSTFQGQAGCSMHDAKRSGNEYRMEYTCKNTQIDGSGIVEGTFIKADSFMGRTTFTGSVQGNPVNEQANMTGHWVSADCGNTKPIQ